MRFEARRRRFLGHASAACVGVLARPGIAPADPAPELRGRIEGLLLGSLIGDALGGPVEFQDRERVQGLPDPPRAWRDEDLLDAGALEASVARLRLRGYAPLRPTPEAYGQWARAAPPGTLTDDSRHKLILLAGLRDAERSGAWPFGVEHMARAYLSWPQSPPMRARPHLRALAADWLAEFSSAARWVLDECEMGRCLPPERLWNGLPTCCGQMTLPPLAAILPGRPEEAYRAAYHLAFFDNGWGRDLNAALVAALSVALVTPLPGTRDPEAAWRPVLSALRDTDPYDYAAVPYTRRSVDRWLEVVERLAAGAAGRPARLFVALEREFAGTIKWEAQVPFVVAFATLALAEHRPLAALQLSIEWGHDTDSYAQLLGALIGALYGASVFPRSLRETVTERLRLDYGEDVADLVALLDGLRLRASRERLFPER